jgi:hypothetical protein
MMAPTSIPTDPHPPLPLPIHIECFDVSVGGGGEGGFPGIVSQGQGRQVGIRIERGALDNDSEATEGTVQCTYVYS